MMEDIVGDYKDKTVTLEDFPFSDPAIKTASVHPCRHASVMKVLLDRADAALKIRLQKIREGGRGAGRESSAGGAGLAARAVGKVESGMEGLVDDKMRMLALTDRDKGRAAKGDQGNGGGGEEWDLVEGEGEEEVAIRVDQYLVVFLKFMASVTPGIEHDFTMGL